MTGRREEVFSVAAEKSKERAEPARARLDQPQETRRRLMRRPTYDPEAFGSFAENFARFMGTARFLLYMTGFVLIWLGWNWVAPPSGSGTPTRSSS